MEMHTRFSSAACAVGLILALLTPLPAACGVTDVADAVLSRTENITSPDTLQSTASKVASERGQEMATAWDVIGGGFVLANRAEPAEYCFAQAVKLAPDDPTHLNNLGFILVDQERYEDAVTVLEAAKAAAPDDPEVLMNLGKARWRLGQQDEALELLEGAAEDEQHPEYGYCYAKALYHSDQQTEAQSVVEKVLTDFPTHEPSLALYHQMTGNSWKSAGARALAQEALALADEVQASIHDWATVLDRIASACGDDSKPGTQMAQFQLQESEIYRTMVKEALKNPHVTDEQLVMTTVQAYRNQLQIGARLYHWYYVAVYCWQYSGLQPDFEIHFMHGFSWESDQNAFNETYVAYQEAAEACIDAAPHGDWCAMVGPSAEEYVKEMPGNINLMVHHIRRAMEGMVRIDSAFLVRYDAFHERAATHVDSDMLDPILDQQKQTCHDFFDVDGSFTGGLGWAIEKTGDEWDHYVDMHRTKVRMLLEALPACGREPPSKDIVDLWDIYQQLLEAQEESGVTVAAVFNLEIAELKIAANGDVQLQVGQIVQGVGYVNAIHGNCGVKFGLGYTIANPGIATYGFGEGAYVTFDSSKGPGAEYTASSIVGLEISKTTPADFASLF